MDRLLQILRLMRYWQRYRMARRGKVSGSVSAYYRLSQLICPVYLDVNDVIRVGSKFRSW